MKDFLILGGGRFGSALAEALYEKGHDVVLADKDEAVVQSLMNRVSHAVIMDATNEAALKKLGVSNFDYVIVAIGGDFEASILATVLVKEEGAKQIICRSDSALSSRVLSSIGADQIIRPAHDMGVRLAEQLITPNLLDSFHLGDKYSVVEIVATKKLTGKLIDLKLPNRFAVQVIAVTQGENLKVSPQAEFEINEGDHLVIIGPNESIEKIENYIAH